MTLKVRHTAMGDITLNPSNLLSIIEFKTLYINSLGSKAADLHTDNIRMFAMGKELKNDLFVYSYDIINESTVQVMISKNNN